MPSPQQPDDTRSLLEYVLARFDRAKDFHRRHTDRWTRFYSLYSSSTDWMRQVRAAGERDRDLVVDDGRRLFGAELFIPYSFWVVETVLPRMLSNDPKVLVMPRRYEFEDAARAMKLVVDAQQERMNISAAIQAVGKCGLMYGLGVGKTRWRRETHRRRVLARGVYGSQVLTTVSRTVWDDPDFEAVDPWDWIWDPHGDSVETCEWVIHRVWRSPEYVRRKIESGDWGLIPPDKAALVDGMASESRWQDVHGDRQDISGQERPRGDLHEVWEFHTRERVITVLDREIVASVQDQYGHCELPFQVFRPTVKPHEMVGVGEIEPIEDLQHEINTLRAQRRDNATAILQRAWFYTRGFLDPDEVKLGPGVMNPVDGSPQEVLFPVPMQEIPASGYQEEQAIHANIEQTTGLSDPVLGKPTATDTTATEVQLVQAAANLRIQAKTRNIEREVIRPAGRQIVALNQEHIVERQVRVPEPPQPGELGAARYKWETFTFEQLAGELEVVVLAGATAPENVPQNRQDAQLLMQAFGMRPEVDQRRLVRLVLEKMGVERPEMFMAPDRPMVPASVLDGLVAAGVPEGLVRDVLARSAPAGAPALNGDRTAMEG